MPHGQDGALAQGNDWWQLVAMMTGNLCDYLWHWFYNSGMIVSIGESNDAPTSILLGIAEK